MTKGGCQCGTIRYEIAGDPYFTGLCHCSDCRGSTGAPMVAWAMYPQDALNITGAAKTHESSPGVQRQFCGECGTALFFTADYIEGLVDVTIASMDDPAALPPTAHTWHSARIPWMEGIDRIEAHAEFPPQVRRVQREAVFFSGSTTIDQLLSAVR